MPGTVFEVLSGLVETDKIHTDRVQPAARTAQETGKEIGAIRDSALVLRVEGAVAALLEGLRERAAEIAQETGIALNGDTEAADRYRRLLEGSNAGMMVYEMPSATRDTARHAADALLVSVDTCADLLTTALHDGLRGVEAAGYAAAESAEAVQGASTTTVQTSHAAWLHIFSGDPGGEVYFG